MTETNFTPAFDDEQPTSHLKVGHKAGDDPGVVEATHGGVSAHFLARTVDDLRLNAKNKVVMNDNVEDVFGGVDHRPFVVDTSASSRAVEPCREATLFVEEASTEDIASFLRSSGYLLHEIEEVLRRGSELVSMHVLAMEPAGYRTLRVTESTDLEFVDREEFEERRREDRQTAGAAGGGDGSRGEMDVDIDVSPRKPVKNFEDDVAGLEEVRETATAMLSLFDPETRSEIQRRYGDEFVERGGGMMLYGPPGCGKTLVSEAIAYEAEQVLSGDEHGDVAFVEVKGGDVMSRYPGESERRVEAVFDRAHSIAQGGLAILFFDEVETLVPDRSDDQLQRHERSLTNAFLQEMNDVEDNLLVIGATNMPFTIDPAATRRFPIQQFIPQPGTEVMAEVWEKHLSSLPDADAIDFEELGEASVGYTPAEIADRVLGADLQREFVQGVVREDREPVEVTTEYLLEKLRETEPKTVRQYVASVREQVDDLEGYPEMRRYVEEQAEAHDINLGRTLDGVGGGGL